MYLRNTRLSYKVNWLGSLRKHPFSSLFAAGDVSCGGTSATQRQKFHTDDANQCLHNESGSHEVPNINLSNFACRLVDFGEVLCSSANELSKTQMLLLEKTIFHKYRLFC